VLAAVVGWYVTRSGAAAARSIAHTASAFRLTSSAPESCKPAARAIRFYSARTHEWQDKRGGRHADRIKWPTCSWARYAAREWHARAEAARESYERWHAYHWDWQSWLPDKWQRIGACETGYGQRPGNWRHSNSSYEGAFGFAVSSWDSFKYRADPRAGPYPADAWQATPRQQYEVALAIERMYGLSGWGCRNA